MLISCPVSAFPSLVQQGTCPKGFGTRYPLLFYETNYNTWAFAGEDGQFLLSYGDPIGTGYHGDFIMGWDSEETLKRAMDECRSMSGQVEDCQLFTLQSEEAQEKCQFAVPRALMDDDPTGPRNGLAVDIPIQYGPQQATKYDIPGQSGVATKSFKPSPPPRSFVGNLSIHPYGDVANPTLMSAASARGAINVTSALASTPFVTWMPLTSVSYVSGVIAPEFSKYLTALPGELVNEPAQGTEVETSESNESGAGTSCDAQTNRQPISLTTTLSTTGYQVVEYLIEDIQLVITTRIKTTIAARTFSIHSTADSDQSGEPSVTNTDESKTSSPTGAMTGPNMFNTIMWVMGTNTYRTPPSDLQHQTSNGNSATRTAGNGLSSKSETSAETTPA